MDVSFIYNEHEITLSRPLEKMTLVIDGKEVDSVIGIFKKDHDAVLKGSIANEDGTIDIVEVDYRSGGIRRLLGTATLLVNGKKIDKRNTT